jgi:glycosidase
VTTEPQFPSASEEVTVFFHADRGNQELMDYDGDIYAHTGVLTDLSSEPSDWRHVIAGWGENISKAKMEQVEANLYKLDITPTIRAFYNVPDKETIRKMAFVFRSSDGNIVGRAEDGGDIYAEVYPAGLNISILEPGEDLIANPGDPVTLKAISNDADSLFLYIDQTLRSKVEDTVLTYEYTPMQPGDIEFVFRALNQDEETSDTSWFHVKGQAQNKAMPGEWRKGINHISEDSVGLALYAPYKDFVYAIGSFSNWRPREKYLMNYDDTKDVYWVGIGGLDPGKEYIFQYMIDGSLRIADPYSRQVSDPNDRYITEDTYPDLIDYPSQKTSQVATVFQTQPEEYNWKNEDFNPPQEEDLVIYELLVRDFLQDHTYKTLTDTLSYLKKLGVNAIELMPVNEFEGNISWGYNPSFYFAPDKYYGPKEDLKAFIDSCHSNGMAVIIDMVLNHSYGQSPMVRMYFDPEAGNYGQPTPMNPWYNVTSPNQTYSWGFDFDHESPQTREFVDSVNSYWLKEYNVDGFRFDFTKGFTNTPGDGWDYDADRIDILKRMADEIWNDHSDAYVILEHLTANREEKELAEYGMLLWGNMNYNYNEATMGYHSDGKSNFSGISYKARDWNEPHLVGYMESHDEQRLMYKNLQYGNSGEDYDVTDTTTALERVEAAANMFFTVPGPKMIWQFGEIGYDVSIDYNGRTAPKPIRWNYLEETPRRALFNVFSELIQLRKQHEVFNTSDFSMDVDAPVKKITLKHATMDVIALSNFDVTSQTTQPGFTNTGNWYEYFARDTVVVEDVQKEISLEPGEYRLYSSEPMEPVDPPMGGGDIISGPAGPEVKVYPNPSHGNVRFEFKLKRAREVSLSVYNMAGQKVEQLTRRPYGRGQHTLRVNIARFQPGIYFYRLKAGNQTTSGRIIRK